MNPVAEKLMFTAALGGNLHAGMQDMVKEAQAKFGLNKPLWEQDFTYLADMSRFEFNYSIANYPRKVSDMILEGLPWTFTLLTLTTIISFVIGNLLGAFQAWPGAPRWLQFLMPPLLALNAIPFFLLGLVLVYVVGFSMQLLPLYGGYGRIDSPVEPVVHHRRRQARHLAIGCDHPGLARRLGARHARNDGHHPRRRLCRLRRGEGPAGSHHLW